ncbi:MAG TPA: NADH-quinone oxidoreductase subunit N [Ignavibacteriaceae bacterium]|nr:NADH-quinone oxidoreductase subunit N [Ignavibacteriaceae bacterium]
MITLILPNLSADLQAILPEISLALTLVAIVVFDLIFIKSKKFLPLISLIGLAIAFSFVVLQFGNPKSAFAVSENISFLSLDSFSSFFKILILITTAFIVLFSVSSKEINSCPDRHGEYYALIFGMVIGMFLMVSANDLILIYLSLELLSLSSYVLAGFVKTSVRNSEASLKYLIYGSASSGIMLFGISILYGITGGTNLTEIHSLMQSPSATQLTFLISVLMIFAGIGFKISIVPFHFWTPDVYEGAPISITAFLSVASKAAGFAVLIRFLKITFVQDLTLAGYWQMISYIDWQTLLILFSIITMTFGNFAALWQDNLKRMLAYSSIAHAGYLMLGVAVLSDQGIMAVLIYFAIYLFMNLGAFYVVMLIANKIDSEEIDDYKGLGYSLPFLGTALGIFLVSLTGLPPTAGFIGKLYLFIALVDAKMITVAIIALLNTVISLYYYIRVLKAMFLVRSDKQVEIPLSPLNYIVLILLIAPVLILGVYFSPLVNIAKESVQLLGF